MYKSGNYESVADRSLALNIPKKLTQNRIIKADSEGLNMIINAFSEHLMMGGLWQVNICDFWVISWLQWVIKYINVISVTCFSLSNIRNKSLPAFQQNWIASLIPLNI